MMVRFHDKYCMPLNIKYLKLYKSDIKPLVDFSFFFFLYFSMKIVVCLNMIILTYNIIRKKYLSEHLSYLEL